MSKHLVIFLLGVFIATLPFLGFPSSWDKVFLIISGAVISFAAILIRYDLRRLRKPNNQDKLSFSPAFVDSAINEPAADETAG
jgi:TRAP-type C4-dicarboxylate transport system permease small subunit